jgi:hypothetical protein
MRQLSLRYGKEPLPKRWLELIHYLNEMERREQNGQHEGGQRHRLRCS